MIFEKPICLAGKGIKSSSQTLIFFSLDVSLQPKGKPFVFKT